MKKLILIIFLTNIVFAGGWDFELPSLSLKENSALYPKRYIWGTSTFIGDSTNYVILNKGLLIYDSLRVRRDLYVGELGGTIYMDTNRLGKMYYTGYDLYFENAKSGGWLYNYVTGTNGGFSWYYSQAGSHELLRVQRTTGLTVTEGNIQLTGGTQQVKIPKDTVSDYDHNDSCTLNKQAGTITTDTLGTDAGQEYQLVLTNSLISATSLVFVSMSGNNTSTGIPIVWAVIPQAGDAIIYLRNIHATDPLNSWVKLSFLVIN